MSNGKWDKPTYTRAELEASTKETLINHILLLDDMINQMQKAALSAAPQCSAVSAYAKLDDWLNEIEGYSLRAERIPADALPWVRTAWELGAASVCDAQPQTTSTDTLCEGCPPHGYPTDKTRCTPCPRHSAQSQAGSAQEAEMDGRITPEIRQRILDAVARYDKCRDSRPLVYTMHHDDPLTVGDLRSIAIALSRPERKEDK